MYIGDTADGSGLHNMVYAVVGNAADEALSGFGNRIDVILNPDGSCTIRDNGRGIPVDMHSIQQISAAEIIMTQLHAGGKFEQRAHELPGHFQGVGVSVVNALSEWLDLRIWREGVQYAARFCWGETAAHVKAVGAADVSSDGPVRGTEITFAPDGSIFADTDFDFARIDRRLRDLAIHLRGATVTLRDKGLVKPKRPFIGRLCAMTNKTKHAYAAQAARKIAAIGNQVPMTLRNIAKLRSSNGATTTMSSVKTQPVITAARIRGSNPGKACAKSAARTNAKAGAATRWI